MASAYSAGKQVRFTASRGQNFAGVRVRQPSVVCSAKYRRGYCEVGEGNKGMLGVCNGSK